MKDISDIADVVELWTWANDQDMTLGELKDELESGIEVSELEDDDNEDDWAEDMAQNIIDEILDRQGRLVDAYPFSCDGNRISLKPESAANSTYLFCLTLSAFPSEEIANPQRGIQFENLAMNAAGNYLKGQTLRIGAPWKTPEIQSYGDLLDAVANLIPDLGMKTRTEAPGGGDAGWDFLVVKGFCDREFPRIIAFGNCATGRTDWLKKGVESQLGLFLSYFSHQHRSVVIEIFAVPFNMTHEDRLKKCGDRTITFDRHRICEHLPEIDGDCITWLTASRHIASGLALV